MVVAAIDLQYLAKLLGHALVRILILAAKLSIRDR